MNTLPLLFLVLGMGVLMVFVVYGSVFGIASVLGIEEGVDIRIMFSFFVISCIVLYGVSFGVFTGIQKDSCGEVKSWKQVAINSLIPLVFQVVLVLLVLFVPWFRNLVGDLFPPETSAITKTASAYAYYSFWAALLGGALGGSLSGSCKVEDKPWVPLPSSELPLPELPTEFTLPEE